MKCGIKRLLALLLCAVLAGCANSATFVQIGGAASTASASVSVSASGTGSGALVAIIFAAVAINAAELREPRVELDPARRVIEQDCSQPIADTSANLKCR